MHAKIINGKVNQFPYTTSDLHRDNPNTSFPRPVPEEVLREYGMHAVSTATMPSITERTQRLELKSQPQEESGQWIVGWSVVQKTAEEIDNYDRMAEFSVRSQRDGLLASTDWVVVKAQETGVEINNAWLDYRQSLRDITDHVNFPYLLDTDWPAEPA